LRAPDDRSLLLRRPFSIHRVDRRPGWAGTVDVVFDIRGRGTELLSHARQHTTLDVLGPLGRPFRFPREPTNCLLVGGGCPGHGRADRLLQITPPRSDRSMYGANSLP
jgi:dihydroorotate dehydrogenase electron transfer subunit